MEKVVRGKTSINRSVNGNKDRARVAMANQILIQKMTIISILFLVSLGFYCEYLNLINTVKLTGITTGLETANKVKNMGVIVLCIPSTWCMKLACNKLLRKSR